jgi:hypothetical protein
MDIIGLTSGAAPNHPATSANVRVVGLEPAARLQIAGLRDTAVACPQN